MDNLERQVHAQSPTRSAGKKLHHHHHSHRYGHDDHDDQVSPLDDCGTTLFKLNALSLGGESGVGLGDSSSPGKVGMVGMKGGGMAGNGVGSGSGMAGSGRKVRKLTTRRWDLGDENEVFG